MANKSIVEIKPIIPTKYKPLQLDAIVKRIVAEEVVEVRTDYERTVKTWKHKPIFVIKWNSDRTGATVGTDNDIFGWVDQGTKPHVIKPKGNYPLRFTVGGKPKTRVMSINSYPGSKGTKSVAARTVHHPGTKARKFTKVILRAHKRMFAKRVQQEITRMAKRNG